MSRGDVDCLVRQMKNHLIDYTCQFLRFGRVKSIEWVWAQIKYHLRLDEEHDRA